VARDLYPVTKLPWVQRIKKHSFPKVQALEARELCCPKVFLKIEKHLVLVQCWEAWLFQVLGGSWTCTRGRGRGAHIRLAIHGRNWKLQTTLGKLSQEPHCPVLAQWARASQRVAGEDPRKKSCDLTLIFCLNQQIYE
jgi:hypothetical protein